MRQTDIRASHRLRGWRRKAAMTGVFLLFILPLAFSVHLELIEIGEKGAHSTEKYIFGSASIVISAIFIYVFSSLARSHSRLETVEENLRRQVEFERLISSISTAFINPLDAEINKAISQALGKAGEFVGADTSYLSLFSEDGKVIDCLKEWLSEGVEPQKVNYKGLSVDRVPWAVGKIKNLENVNIHRLDNLPPEAGAEREILKATGVKSVLIVPVTYYGAVAGFLGFNSIRKEREWAESDISLLKIVGESIIAALERQKMEHFLKDSREYIQSILNTQDDIIVITDGASLIYVNKAFLDSFGYEYLQEFKLERRCICNMFIKEDGFVYAEWGKCPEILTGENREGFKVKMFDAKKGQNRVFLAKSHIFPSEKKLFLLSFTDVTDIQDESKRLKHLSETDPLTGIYNRLRFNNALEIEIARARRHKRVFSLLMFDIDHFKDINDSFGHEVGDETLKTLTNIVSRHVRVTDTFARWGGEEFVILVVETPAEGGGIFAEKLRKEIEETSFGIAGKVTCSFGVTQFKVTDDITSTTKRVDEALYEAKGSGRNRVCVR